MEFGTLFDVHSYSIDTQLLMVSNINSMSFCLEDNSDILLLAGSEIKLILQYFHLRTVFA